MIKLSDLITTKVSGCAKCFSILYAIPCQVDRDFPAYMKAFGKPIYPLKSTNFIRIDSDGGYHIEARLNAKVIKFVMPKKFEKVALDKIVRKVEFELALATWISNKLNIAIITSEQDI